MANVLLVSQVCYYVLLVLGAGLRFASCCSTSGETAGPMAVHQNTSTNMNQQTIWVVPDGSFYSVFLTNYIWCDQSWPHRSEWYCTCKDLVSWMLTFCNFTPNPREWLHSAQRRLWILWLRSFIQALPTACLASCPGSASTFWQRICTARTGKCRKIIRTTLPA